MSFSKEEIITIFELFLKRTVNPSFYETLFAILLEEKKIIAKGSSFTLTQMKLEEYSDYVKQSLNFEVKLIMTQIDELLDKEEEEIAASQHEKIEKLHPCTLSHIQWRLAWIKSIREKEKTNLDEAIRTLEDYMSQIYRREWTFTNSSIASYIPIRWTDN